MQPINLEAILPHLWISGRSSRAEWWRIHIICAVLATMLEHTTFAQLAPRDGSGMQPISLLWPIASLALMWVSFASVVRRFHDRGKSGWWALLDFRAGHRMAVADHRMRVPARQNRPLHVPAFTPAAAPAPVPAPTPARASRNAARLQATPRAGTVQRAESSLWTANAH